VRRRFLAETTKHLRRKILQFFRSANESDTGQSHPVLNERKLKSSLFFSIVSRNRPHPTSDKWE